MEEMKLLVRTYLLVGLLMAVGCQQETVLTPQQVQTAGDAVVFNSYVGQQRGETRATLPADGAGAQDITRLRETGFGVWALHTQNTPYAVDGTQSYNFMYNQEVAYSGGWTYAPVKYWPNDNNPADDQNDDTSNDPAQGSLTRSYLTFFAYAPWTDAPTEPADDTDGIVAMTSNSTNAPTSALTYRTCATEHFSATESVDLLWAWRPDCYKTMASGEGMTTGAVQLVFKHALSALTFTVQGLFDRVTEADTSTDYLDDVNANTRILIERVSLEGSPLFSEGTMHLAPQTADAEVPLWTVNTGKSGNLTVSGLQISPALSNTYEDSGEKKYWNEETPASGLLTGATITAAEARALFDQLPEGVRKAEQPLRTEDYYYMVIPNKEYMDAHSSARMQIRMVYYVITHDEELLDVNEGCPKYFSIVKNDVTATFSSAFSFEANKKYKIRLMPGLMSVKFEVVSVDDWDTPISVNPKVVDWVTVTKEYDVTY